MHFISSAMASFCLETTVEDAMQTVRDAGFDSLDFPLSVYSRPQDAPLRGDDWRQWARGVRPRRTGSGCPSRRHIASWEQAIPDDLHYESPYEIYERTMEACAILGCRQLIFHPVLYLHRMPDRSLWPRIHDWNVRWFHELLPLAEKFDIVINLKTRSTIAICSSRATRPCPTQPPKTCWSSSTALARTVCSFASTPAMPTSAGRTCRR